MKTATLDLTPIARFFGFVVAAWIVCATLPANGAEASRLEMIGFSADGRHVAFEEYGAQDGSGFPYSNIFVIDVAANDWVSGTPVRVLITDEEMPDEEQMWRYGLQEARGRSQAQVQPALDRYGIVPGNTGTAVISHPYSDLDANPYEARFSIAANFNPNYAFDENLLRLTLRDAPSPDCAMLTPPPTRIFTLELLRNDQPPLTLQHDTQLFSSRGCAIDYRIHSVYLLPLGVEEPTLCCAESYAMLVLVGMGAFGFEGPDWRLLGVTAMLQR